MVLHARFVEQHIANKQVALENRASVVWKRRGCDSEVGLKRMHQSFCDRTDIALCCAVEGRAVFEINLLGPLALQPLQSLQRLVDSVLWRNGARFQSNDYGVYFSR